MVYMYFCSFFPALTCVLDFVLFMGKLKTYTASYWKIALWRLSISLL